MESFKSLTGLLTPSKATGPPQEDPSAAGTEGDAHSAGTDSKKSSASTRRSQRILNKKELEIQEEEEGFPFPNVEGDLDSEDDEVLTNFDGSEPSDMDPPSDEDEEGVYLDLTTMHCRADTDTQTVEGKMKLICGKLIKDCKRHSEAQHRHEAGIYAGVKAAKLFKGKILVHGLVGTLTTEATTDDELESRRTLQHVETSDEEDEEEQALKQLQQQLLDVQSKLEAKAKAKC